MRAFGANRYINKVMLIKITKGRRIGIIVEIAGYDNPCTIIERIDRIYGRSQLAGYLQAVGTRNLFAATPARRMQYKDMERIITHNPPRSVENISRRTSIRQRRDADGTGLYKRKRRWLIKQSHIYASFIRRIGHHIIIIHTAKS